MRHETEGVTESLLQSAKKEFLEHGFHDASMRRISAASGVSTNSIYTRFHDKKGLFEAIVKEAGDGLMKLYLTSIERARDSASMDSAMQEGSEGTDLVLEYIFEHKDEFKLIFCCSAGTAYETYFDRLAATEEKYYKEFAKLFTKNDHTIDDFFIHVHCIIGWQYVYEILTHDKTYEEAKKYMKNVCVFNAAGWKAVLGEID